MNTERKLNFIESAPGKSSFRMCFGSFALTAAVALVCPGDDVLAFAGSVHVSSIKMTFESDEVLNIFWADKTLKENWEPRLPANRE